MILVKIATNRVLKMKQTKNKKGVMYLYSQLKLGEHFHNYKQFFMNYKII